MGGETQNGGVLAYRVDSYGKKLDELAAWRSRTDAERAAEKVQMENLNESVEALVKTVDGLRNVLIGFALTVAGSAIVFAFSILVATGKL